MSRRVRVMAALVMAPLAIGSVLFLPTPLLAAAAARAEHGECNTAESDASGRELGC